MITKKRWMGVLKRFVVFLLISSLSLLQTPTPSARAMVEESTPPAQAIVDDLLPAESHPSGDLPDYVPGELIVKLKEGKTMEDLLDLNAKFNVSSHGKVFESLSSSADDIKKMKDKLKDWGHLHESWYWQFDKDYRAKLELEKKTLEAEIKKAEERQIITDEAITQVRLEDIYKLEVGGKDADILSMAKIYSSHPAVEYAEPNYIVKANSEPNDTYWNTPSNPGSWGQPYSDLWGLRKIQADKAWDKTKGAGIIVAVIDTGVDYNHEDIKDNMWVNPADGTYGFNIVDNNRDPMDDFGHGTHVAGTIAAIQDNGIGITGVAPEARIMALKGLNGHGSGSISDLAQCVVQAVRSGADVLNNSWGGKRDEPIKLEVDTFKVAQDSGVVSVVAAGNDNVDTSGFGPAYLPSVIAVAASNPDDLRCSFSNYGVKADVSAPGGDRDANDGENFLKRNILSLRSDNKSNPTGKDHLIVGDKYYRNAGTSMACPHVAGVVALMLSANPVLFNKNTNKATQLNKVLSILKATGETVLEPDPSKFVGPRVNAYNAVLQALGGKPLVGALKPIDGSLLPLPVVRGIASGANFAGYALHYARTNDLSTWFLLVESSTPVSDDRTTTEPEDGVLYHGPLVNDSGSYILRLTVRSTDGLSIVSKTILTVPNIITVPLSNDLLSKNAVIPIKADIKGHYQDYVVEWGEGKYPTQWRTTGITRLHPGPGANFKGSIAQWDTKLVPQSSYVNGSFYTLRVGVTISNHIVYSYKRLLYLDKNMKEGWPQYLEKGRLKGTADITVTDLDGDGRKEIVVIAKENYSPTDGIYNPGYTKISVYNHDGSLRWTNPLSVITYTVPTIGDIDNDGKQEIFIANSENKTLYGFKNDGKLYLKSPYTKLSKNASYIMADLNMPGDVGQKSLVGATDGSESGDGSIFILDKDGKMRKQIDFKNTETKELSRPRMPAVGNFDDDPELEIVVAQPRGVQVFNIDGTLCEGWPSIVDQLPKDYHIYSSPVVGDIDGDGYDNVVVVAVKTKNVSPTSVNLDLAMWAFDKNGAIMPGWPVLMNQLTDQISKIPNSSRYQSPALGDFNQDGKLEIALGVGQSHYLFDYRGNIVPGWPKTVPAPNVHRVQMAIGDVDGDGAPDLISSAGGFQKEIFTEESLRTTGGIFAWKFDGTPIDLNPDQSMDFLPTEFESKPPLTLTDLDGDGRVDIVASTTRNFLSVENDFALSDKGRLSINAWGLDVPYHATTMQWPMYQHDSMRTGRYVSPTGVTPVPTPGPGPQPPAQLSSLNAVAISESQINLTWSDKSDDETSFKIYRSPTNSNYVVVATVGAGIPSFSDTGLTANTTYYYKVSAVNDAGESALSTQASAKTNPGPQPPAKPSSLSASAVSESQINLSWKDNSNNETGFKIYRSPTNSNYVEVATAVAGVTSFSDTGLAANTTYYYKVSAVNNAGESGLSSQASAKTKPGPQPPAKPRYLDAVAVSKSEIYLVWSDDSNNETGFNIYRQTTHFYNVGSGLRNGILTLIQTVPAGTTTYHDTGLTADTEYSYEVKSFNNAGESVQDKGRFLKTKK